MADTDSFPAPPTKSEIDRARRLGVGLDQFRQFRRLASDAASKPGAGADPADIEAESRSYQHLRREPGLFKPRNQAPNLFVTAAKAPGEIIQMVLTGLCYLVLLFAGLMACGSERVKQIPGIFQVILMGMLVIPAMMLSSFIWRKMGEPVRDFLRLSVRVWPLTLIALLFLLAGIKLLTK